MNLTINWSDPVLPEEEILGLQTTHLDDFNVSAGEVDRLSLFFILLTSHHHYLGLGDRPRAGRLAFLLAYYLYIPLTPPGSWELSRHYIARAVELDDREEYRSWQRAMEEPN